MTRPARRPRKITARIDVPVRAIPEPDVNPNVMSAVVPAR